MAGDEVDRVLDRRNPASPLDLHHPLLEQALLAPRPDDRLPIGVSDGRVDGVGPRCSPIVDILPGGQVVPCLPLALLDGEPLPEGENAAALRRRFTARLSGYRRLGVFRKCAACDWRKNARCNGGCLSASMQRLRPVPASELGT